MVSGHLNNHKPGSVFPCKLSEHMITVHDKVLDKKYLKFMAIDSIEDCSPPTNVDNIDEWRIIELEKLEEHYRTMLCTYIPHGLNVKGESSYKRWAHKRPIRTAVPMPRGSTNRVLFRALLMGV